MKYPVCSIALAATLVCPNVGNAQKQGTAPTYRVYPIPIESPAFATPLPPADARELLTDPSDLTASPFGWHDDDGVPGEEYTTTQGNNVLVFFDQNANSIPEAGEFADGGSELEFDFPLDLENPPFASANAVLTNFFYWTNAFHDVLYQYGFDEASGNAQQNTYGRGGVGGDAVRVEGRDNSSGATVSVPPEGSSPRVIISLLDTPPLGALALDNWITIHLLAHTTTSRLTGGPANPSCLLNSEQPGEGWADWYALMFTMRDADTRTTLRRDDGIRPTAYTTDFSVNDRTYGDTQTEAVPFGIGYVWATILWEMTWDLIDAHGFDPDLYDAGGSAGNLVALRLVTEAMKLQPCSPGFVDARDAILAADQVLYGGDHEEILWNALARRGLGLGANQGSSNSNADNVEAFDSPFPTSVAGSPPSHSLAIESVAPNPAAQSTRITFRIGNSDNVRLSIYDMRGRRISIASNGIRFEGRHVLRVETGDLAPGVYALRLETEDEVAVHRFVVAR